MNAGIVMLDSVTFEVTVDNAMVAKDMTNLIPTFQAYLRNKLRNNKICMKVRESEEKENIRIFGRVESFQEMAKKNPSLMQLKETFGLELY